MGFIKAMRDDIFAKILFIAVSGGGKSYSGLRFAIGMLTELNKKTGEKNRLAYIGTEGSRDKYYANEFDYDLMQIKGDFKPESYIDAIDEALDAGYKVIFIDSITHEWTGKNGCLEIHSKIPGNSYVAWDKVTPRHNKLMDKILECEAHVVVTVRGKDKYVLEEANGKQVPRKVLLGYQQRDDIEYLFTTSFTLEQDSHLFTAVKDNTHLFEDRNDIITERDGGLIIDWSSNGDIKEKRAELEKAKEEAKAKIALNEKEEAKAIVEEKEKKIKGQKETPKNSLKASLKDTKTPEVKEDPKSEPKKTLKEIKDEVVALCQKLVAAGKRDLAVSTIGGETGGDGNPLNITDIVVAEKVLAALKLI